jgi:hypothetical protein
MRRNSYATRHEIAEFGGGVHCFAAAMLLRYAAKRHDKFRIADQLDMLCKRYAITGDLPPLMAASSTGVADFSVTVSSNEAQRILI